MMPAHQCAAAWVDSMSCITSAGPPLCRNAAVMPVAFMTKLIKYEKMMEQLNYLINVRHAVWPA